MASTIVETIRQTSEDVECFEKAGAIALSEKERLKARSRKRTLWDHRVKGLAEKTHLTSEKLLTLLKDEDGLLASERAALMGIKYRRTDGGTLALADPALGDTDITTNKEVWRTFYDRLKAIQDKYKQSTANAFPEIRDVNQYVIESIEQLPGLSHIFPGEEQCGKCLDLRGAFEDFLNWKRFRRHRELEAKANALARIKRTRIEREKRRLKNAKNGIKEDDLENIEVSLEIDMNDPEIKKKLEFHEIDYVKFLRTYVTDYKLIPRHCKYRDSDYIKYLSELQEYLKSFYERLHPLVVMDKMVNKIEREFERHWQEQRLSSWIPHTCDMESTYALATDRLFATAETCNAHRKSKKYEKLAVKLTGNEEKQRDDSIAHDKELAKLEFIPARFADLLTPYLEWTIRHVRKRQSRNLEELEAEPVSESDEDEGPEVILGRRPGEEGPNERNDLSDESDDDEEQTKKIRNPLNLPLGWDGKPIPYWLYKLHGLGQEFKCEICGNHSYWGRRVFERHFQEWRHAFGMRCLKIPNTVHFKEITKIEDALALYERLKTETEAKSFLADQEIEVEDAEGNVMTPQTYDDLRKQGILT
eukprot:Blabericola_migrator_1__649@NODE_1160_length_5242_cov_189_748406_g790_i0_p2_GENE_NODE_1160_length_5242_cov_189_748406_g790_i0NODE_1160_length_5242_cov_189_748406_g790_i0_p2_ORF_typecomplete_len589_score133_76DUF3449/PF11931_8/5_2e03DUF3449/PF11931_8/5_5e02DUF3449/PF11931_8/2_2e72SF3A3/PF16837_5/8_7e17SF3A3/PF16837_5/1_7e04SF3a60_bindingd/PF12108_8/0_057SF3a60_bindingd/PF12108_8/1_7e02SF3a60_bindingd/PF12108_8/2e03INCENP_ARKbind/PF03941_15/0_53_NODE_1160_length_5242_cov_189_748406_g790_i04752241